MVGSFRVMWFFLVSGGLGLCPKFQTNEFVHWNHDLKNNLWNQCSFVNAFVSKFALIFHCRVAWFKLHLTRSLKKNWTSKIVPRQHRLSTKHGIKFQTIPHFLGPSIHKKHQWINVAFETHTCVSNLKNKMKFHHFGKTLAGLCIPVAFQYIAATSDGLWFVIQKGIDLIRLHLDIFCKTYRAPKKCCTKKKQCYVNVL